MPVATETLQALRKSFRVIEREIAVLVKNSSSCCGVSLAQCHVLLELEHAGTVSLSDLSSSMGLDRSTLSRTVDSLVNDGFVERKTFPEDRREVRIMLTQKGKKHASSINTFCDDYYSELLSNIPHSEFPAVIKVLSAVGQAIVTMKAAGKSYSCCSNKGGKNE
jgi:DNA-binding MarR family transcriptional regulator